MVVAAGILIGYFSKVGRGNAGLMVERARLDMLGGGDPICPVCLEPIKASDKVRGEFRSSAARAGYNGAAELEGHQGGSP